MKRYLVYAFAFLSRFALFPLYLMSGWMPRRDDLWVFGSWGGRRYADNAAAYFRFCHKRAARDIRLVWISRHREIVRELRAGGYDAEWIYSPAGIAACLRAGTYFFDCFAKDINFWTSRGARLVNLWSGVPLKTFERDIDHVDNRYYRLFHGNVAERFFYGLMMPWHLRRPDYIIATSGETAAITQRAFDIDERRVLVTGFPRNDALLRQNGSPVKTGLPQVFADAVKDRKHVFLYLPTFRDSGKPFLRFDWQKLNDYMKSIDAAFVCKFHPIDRSNIPGGYSHIQALTQDIDVYALLPHTDVLVSDYSSIIFDFMLLERPIVYYAPDLDEFVSENRSLNFDPLEIAVGPVCGTFNELIDALGESIASAASGKAHTRDNIVRRLHAHANGSSCDRVFEALAAARHGERSRSGSWQRGNTLPALQIQERSPEHGE